MGVFHYENASVRPGPKSQPPAASSTHQAPHSTVRSGFSSAQKTLAPPTVDDTQPSQSAPRSSDQKQHPPSADSNSKRRQREPSDLKSAEEPTLPPSADSTNQPPPASRGVQPDTPSQATATPNNAQQQGRHHSETRRGSTHYDIRVVNLTYNVTPPQTPLQAQAADPANGHQPRARSQPVHVDDASKGTSHNKQETASSRVQVFCSLIFIVELVNIAFFAYYLDVHKGDQGAAYNFGVGFLISACVVTCITLLDMVNAFYTKSGCWYILSACFWGGGGVLFFFFWFCFLIYYSVDWSRRCPVKYPDDSYCPAKVIAPVWVFNLPLFILMPFFVSSLMDAALSQD